MNRWSVQGGTVVARRFSLALTALIATIAMIAVSAQPAAAKGGGQIGESFGSPGTGNAQFFDPAMFGVDSQTGTVYTGDLTGTGSETANYRIQQLSSSGEFKASAEINRFPTTEKFLGLQGIAVDHELGRIYMVATCRVALGGGTTCKASGGKFAALRILVYSTTPEGTKLVPDKTLPTISLPTGSEEIYSPNAIAVDPSNHDILILGEDNEGHKVVQRFSSAGVAGARFVDSSGKLKPSAGATASYASSLAVSNSGETYTITGQLSPGATNTRAWRLPPSLASLEEVPGFASQAELENWPLGHESKVAQAFGGPQLAISTDGSTLYWKEYRTNSEEKTPGELVIRGFSLSKDETTALWGGGTTRCKITTSSAPLAATTSGNLALFDTGAPTTKPTETPAYGLKVLTFGSSGTGCVEPVAKFTVNGKAEGEEPTVKPGETVTFNASSSELAGGFRKELIWKFGDGTEKVVTEPKEGEEAPATVTHVYSSTAKVTVTLEIKLKNPPYGNPAPDQRTFNVGTPVSGFNLKVKDAGTGTGTVTSSPSGINCGATCEAEYESGKEVTLTATPEGGSTFSGWSGAGCSGTGTCKVTMSAAKEVTATFALEQHLLTVTKSGSGSGTVTSSPPGINCGSECSANFAHGTEVTLTPAAAGGSEFKGWSGACSGTGTCKVTMSAAKEVTAEFGLNAAQFTLKVNKTGTGSGPVTSTPAGIDCHGVCEASFSKGTVVTLVGTPNVGTKPVVWTGCDEVNGSNECKVTMSAAKEVTAFFDGTLCTGSNITGAGSSLQKIAQTEVWGPAFQSTVCNSGTHPTITYNPTGSGSGLKEWNATGTKGSINTGLAFIGTDDAPSEAQIANVKSKAGGAEVAVIPVAQTAISILANPPAGCEVEGITNSNLAGVFEGRIREWSKLEGAEGTCNSPITRVVREDASGTTYQLKNYLDALYKKGLSCTKGATEGKASWAELEAIESPNLSWPESCSEKSLSALVRPAGAGGAEEVKKVNATAGSIGYAALPDAEANKTGTTAILALQNNGQKTGGAAEFAEPAAGATANCGGMAYQVPKLNGRRDIDWSGVYGAHPAIGASSYPLCTLTYDLAFHGYKAAGFTEGQEITARDYLYGYLVQSAGQKAIGGHYYSPLPSSSEERLDVLGAAQKAASSISY